MILEGLLVAVAVAGGAWAWALSRRAKAHGRWKLVLGEVATKLGGRASPGSMFDAPELRAELEGTTVTLKLQDVHLGPKGVARADANIGGVDERLRMYVGWDAPATPEGLAHFPEVIAARGVIVEGKLDVRGSDAEVTRRFAELAAAELVELRALTGGRALEVIVRGGYLELRALGAEASAAMVEHLARSAARLVLMIRVAASKDALPAGKVPLALGAGARVTCELCTDYKRDGEAWIRCETCGAPYHFKCWAQSGACVVAGCGGLVSKPFEG
ncbi:hypothetical protein L6R52_19975 [Myxococcota bacterium]|nr:hypothetical protein [Myxococcota bacterium]